MTEDVECSSLKATFRGKVITKKINSKDERVLQHRGIKFGTIPARFAKALLKDDWEGSVVDCTKFGYEVFCTLKVYY